MEVSINQMNQGLLHERQAMVTGGQDMELVEKESTNRATKVFGVCFGKVYLFTQVFMRNG